MAGGFHTRLRTSHGRGYQGRSRGASAECVSQSQIVAGGMSLISVRNGRAGNSPGPASQSPPSATPPSVLSAPRAVDRHDDDYGRSGGNQRQWPPTKRRRETHKPALNTPVFEPSPRHTRSPTYIHGPFLTQATYTLLDVELLNGRTKRTLEKMGVIMVILQSSDFCRVRPSRLLTSMIMKYNSLRCTRHMRCPLALLPNLSKC